MPVVPQKVNKKDDINIDCDTGQNVFKEAIHYYNAAMILEKTRRERELFPPVLMNATFACELFSKSILYKAQCEKVIKGHSLKSLYDDFEDEDKAELKELYSHNEEIRFEQWIDEIGDLFEFWRYRFEHRKYSTHYGFVLDYMEVLKRLAESKYGKRVNMAIEREGIDYDN